MTPSAAPETERLFWLIVWRSLIAIAGAIKKYKLAGVTESDTST